jgi:hypothetical protein
MHTHTLRNTAQSMCKIISINPSADEQMERKGISDSSTFSYMTNAMPVDCYFSW